MTIHIPKLMAFIHRARPASISSTEIMAVMGHGLGSGM